MLNSADQALLEMILWILAMPVIIIVTIVLLVNLNKKQKQTFTSTVQTNRSTIEKRLENRGFTITSRLDLRTVQAFFNDTVVTFSTFVDTYNKRIAFAFLMENDNYKIVDFDQIVGCDIMINGESTKSISSSNGYINRYGLTGGLTSSTTTSYVETITFNIMLKDINDPIYSIIMNSSRLNTSSQQYEEIMQYTSKLKSLIMSIVNENNSHTENADNDSNNIGKLKKYKELLDAGVITQEEFEVKKRQIMKL